MSVRKDYTCDLCGSSITEAEGVGIIHKARGDIEAVYLKRDGAGRHLCNSCVKGLRVMLADLDRTMKIQEDLDRAEAEAR